MTDPDDGVGGDVARTLRWGPRAATAASSPLGGLHGERARGRPGLGGVSPTVRVWGLEAVHRLRGPRRGRCGQSVTPLLGARLQTPQEGESGYDIGKVAGPLRDAAAFHVLTGIRWGDVRFDCDDAVVPLLAGTRSVGDVTADRPSPRRLGSVGSAVLDWDTSVRLVPSSQGPNSAVTA